MVFSYPSLYARTILTFDLNILPDLTFKHDLVIMKVKQQVKCKSADTTVCTVLIFIFAQCK